LAGLLKRSFSRDRLRLTVVELALRVDVQPASRMDVLVPSYAETPSASN
jgi:hypothetical protein